MPTAFSISSRDEFTPIRAVAIFASSSRFSDILVAPKLKSFVQPLRSRGCARRRGKNARQVHLLQSKVVHASQFAAPHSVCLTEFADQGKRYTVLQNPAQALMCGVTKPTSRNVRCLVALGA